MENSIEGERRSIVPIWSGILVLSVCVPLTFFLLTFNAWGVQGIDAAGIDSANRISVATALTVPTVGAVLWAIFRRNRKIIWRVSCIGLGCTVVGFLSAGVIMAISL